jgi:glucuronate isomerase
MPIMQKFIHDNFLLANDAAQRLYHDYAADAPIIDYHCHLPPDQIASNHVFADLSEIWLAGDHYKWRAMRTNGVDERFCTGDATPPKEKFDAWAGTVPKCLRNPLYHWTHLELKTPFGIDDCVLSPATADDVWARANAQLPELSTQAVLKRMNVEVVCTTDDPADDLANHLAYAKAGSPAGTKMLPTFRPDKALPSSNPASYNSYLDQLGSIAGVTINTYDDLLQAMQQRHDFFHAAGCRLSDHGLEYIEAATYDQSAAAAAFSAIRGGRTLSIDELATVRRTLLHDLAVMDHAKGWTQQFHLGALRDNNDRLLGKLGPDTGFDSIGDFSQAVGMSQFFNRLDSTDQLARTILYNLNPRDNEVFATMIGNFQDGSIPGKMQFGSGWWFLDQWDGMTKQINALSNLGLLSRFVGMLTDSRSFLSYTRHEYFRRLLCTILGQDIEQGAVPADFDLIGQMVRDISYQNAREYFGFYDEN